MMTKLHHPNVMEFKGLCFLEESILPVLMMEKMLASLNELVDGVPNVPLPLKQMLLQDVARGLDYLHSYNPPILHCDITAPNVLLTCKMVAMISDIGNTHIAKFHPGEPSHPNDAVYYMPPEAFDGNSCCSFQLDIFSFGHLALYTLTQVRNRQLECCS